MSDTYVPMISSGVAGPLGVLHLPRLWLKVSLEAQGKLADGYPGIGRGFDAMTCATLGLEEQAVNDFIKQSRRLVRVLPSGTHVSETRRRTPDVQRRRLN